MKKLMLVGGLFMITTLLQADAYLLIMSKNDKLCQNINRMFNDDLVKYKKVRLEDHKEFNAVVWDKEFEFFDYPDDRRIIPPLCDERQTYGCKNAIFDINNDGKDELVAYLDERLYGMAGYNEIQWVAQDPNAPLEFHYIKRLKSLGGDHHYKELPVQYTDKKYGFKAYISSDQDVLLRPFKISNTFYIAIFFNSDGRDNWTGFGYRSKDLNDNNMVSISKYDAANEQHDLCFMMRVFTSPTYKKTKKDN